jgi:hypothetical protein
MFNQLLAFVKREPALIVTVGLALVELAVSFGLNITDRQTSAITAVLTVVAGVVVRSQVSPTP